MGKTSRCGELIVTRIVRAPTCNLVCVDSVQLSVNVPTVGIWISNFFRGSLHAGAPVLSTENGVFLSPILIERGSRMRILVMHSITQVHKQ
jgi:hypothetical protein